MFNIDFLIQNFFKALEGIPVTLGITVIALLFGSLIALVLNYLRANNIIILKQLSSIYISFIRSTPIILQILVFYSLVPSLLNALVLKLHWPIDVFSINPFWYACIVFSLNASAMLVGIFHSALLSVNQGQLEACYSVGMTKFQGYKRILVPQALVSAMPNLCNLTVMLIKSSSLVFLMSVADITAIAKTEASFSLHYIEAYVDIFLIYLLICSVVQLVFGLIEKQISKHKEYALKA